MPPLRLTDSNTLMGVLLCVIVFVARQPQSAFLPNGVDCELLLSATSVCVPCYSGWRFGFSGFVSPANVLCTVFGALCISVWIFVYDEVGHASATHVLWKWD